MQTNDTSTKSNQDAPIEATVPTLQEYMTRLELLQQPPYQDYFDAFMSTLCQAKGVADIVATGKLKLADSKREQALSYGVSILGDIGGVFGPTGTLSKLVNDSCGYFIQERRKRGYIKVAETAANPFHFILLIQALVDSLLFYFEPEEWCVYNSLDAASKGKELATNLIRAIKEKKIAFSQDGHLAISLGALLQYVISQNLINSNRTYPEWVTGQYEPILLLATAQLLRLPVDYFLKNEKLLSDLEDLKKKVAEMSSQHYDIITEQITWAEQNNKAHLTQELADIKTRLETQCENNQALLEETLALAPQARLYLYGAASKEEIERHTNEATKLKKQLTINLRIQEQISTLQKSLAPGHEQTELLIGKLRTLETDVIQQAYQLKLTLGLTQAMLYQKRQCFKEAQAELEQVLIILDEALQKNHLKADSATFKASVYTLQGKIARASQPKEKWKETVLKYYNQALAVKPEDSLQASILSSKGALLDDLGKHTQAIGYHRQAYQLQKPEVDTVTLSNLAWCLYHQAIEQVPASQSLLQEALSYIEKSLERKPSLAGTWLYRGKIMQALNRQEEAMASFTRGLTEQPDYIKLFVERAKLYEANKEKDKALDDVAQAQKLLRGFSTQSPDYQELQTWLSIQQAVSPRLNLKPMNNDRIII